MEKVKMGRPREFDQGKIVNKIMFLFWEKGFKGTSMDDLVKTTGLNKGSLYVCFGNKEKLFKLALKAYVERGASLSSGTESPLNALCNFYSSLVSEADLPKKKRRGCFIFNSCLEFGNQNEPLTSFVLSIGKQRERFFSNLIQTAQEKGELPKKLDKDSAAQRAFATAFTIREMSKFKPEKDFLCNIVNAFFESIGATQRVSLKGPSPA
jgi:TetR/AcrR family transcriptional regulator, transcriptional repressor for nem operon